MWLNADHASAEAIADYQSRLSNTCPRHVVIDDLFSTSMLDKVVDVLHENERWKQQRHTYSALYVDDEQWRSISPAERFVQRDLWLRSFKPDNIADQFLNYLRSPDFMALLSIIFEVELTDLNVADSAVNTNYFRLGKQDFIKQHADDSPGREVCLLLYLNKTWAADAGGKITFLGANSSKPLEIEPIYNRCIVFDPASKGSEHWVQAMQDEGGTASYRYNLTSWYWSE